jgi:anaphase-promoting complex subunit 8
LYLLAKSYYDCREFDRCAAVFLPSGIPKGPLASNATKVDHRPSNPAKESSSANVSRKVPSLKGKPLSQKSLFLALYARYMSGEKKKEEAMEMILGPADKTSTVNRELVGISRILEDYFTNQPPDKRTEGWLEYLYGIVLAKGKNELEARRWLIRSVNLCPFIWGAWQELSDLIGTTDEVWLKDCHILHY